MRAVTIVDGGVEVREHADPVPGHGQVLVRVHSAGLNGADVLQVAGRYPPPPGVPADLPGLELAGEVAGAGPGTSRFATGDRVMAVVTGAGQAELAVVHERELMPVPEGVDLLPAGGLPEAFATAYDALAVQAGLASGERLLVNGAAGGVGTAAVQLGVATGARVVASVRAPEVRAAVAALGARVVDPADTPAHGPYDVVLELVGGPNLPADVDALAVGGRIVVIGVGAGRTAELSLTTLMARRGRICASTLRARPLEEKAMLARLLEARVLPLFSTGRLHVPVHAVLPLSRVDAAYAAFAAGRKIGKIVLDLSP